MNFFKIVLIILTVETYSFAQAADYSACFALVKEFKFKAIYQTVYEARGILRTEDTEVLKSRLMEPVSEMRLDPGISNVGGIDFDHKLKTAKLTFEPEEGEGIITIHSRVDKNGIIHVSNLDTDFEFYFKDDKCIPKSFHFKKVDPNKDWDLSDCKEIASVLGSIFKEPGRQCLDSDLGWKSDLKKEIIKDILKSSNSAKPMSQPTGSGSGAK